MSKKVIETATVKLVLEALEKMARLTSPLWALENNYAGHLEAIAALKALAEPPAPVQSALDAMWMALAGYQPQADAAGHGETWAAMCKEKTADAVNAAWSASAYAAYYDASDDAAAAYAAVAAADDSIMYAQRAIDYINKAKEKS